MALPFYVSPEQVMKDRAEYARKGIARGRALVAIEYVNGVVYVGENPSRSLYKTSEIYDRIAFAAVGKYNEFESLRVSGIRLADVKGYQYGREDVTAKSLANAYSQALGAIFMGDGKPFEVEVVIAQVNGERTGEERTGGGPIAAASADGDGAQAAGADVEVTDGEVGSADGAGLDHEAAELYHILYDGSIVDEHRFVAIGGHSEELAGALDSRYRDGMTLEEVVRMGAEVLSSVTSRQIPPGDLEVSGLDRTRRRRKFFRLDDDVVAGMLRDAAA